MKSTLKLIKRFCITLILAVVLLFLLNVVLLISVSYRQAANGSGDVYKRQPYDSFVTAIMQKAAMPPAAYRLLITRQTFIRLFRTFPFV